MSKCFASERHLIQSDETRADSKQKDGEGLQKIYSI